MQAMMGMKEMKGKSMKKSYFNTCLFIFSLLVLQSGVMSQESNELYDARCAACHEAPANEAVRAPVRSDLENLTPEIIYRALTQGVMRISASGLTNGQMQSVAEYLTGRPMSALNLEMTTNLCSENDPMINPALAPSWNGWGGDHRNSRAALNEGISADNINRLQLKWAFGLPGEDQPRAQPAVVSGRLFVGNKAGAIYSLDAKSGCTYWTYLPRNRVRRA
jgi:polyvinyl alcohol dehydrogenase (cytochrome)